MSNILHPQSSKGKYVVKYKYDGKFDYLKTLKGDVIYFDTEDEAVKNAMGKAGWIVCVIKNPLGK